MTMCTSSVGTDPTTGLDWYIGPLQGPFGDAIRGSVARTMALP
jgi:hypothetical protein